jgi:uncharacterized protein
LIWHSSSRDIAGSLWSAAFGPPHEGRFWFEAIERGTASGQFIFKYGCLVRDEQPIGIVPAFRFDVPLELILPPTLARLVLPLPQGPLSRYSSQRTFFVGNVAGEEGHVGLIPGIALEDVALFIHGQARAMATQLGAPMLVWKDFSQVDRATLDTLMRKVGAFRIPSYPGSSIPLLSGGYTKFLSTLRSDRRHRIRSKLRKGKAAISACTNVEVHPTELVLHEIFALFEQTRHRARTSFETLTVDFFRWIAASEVASFVVMREPATKRMIAFMLMLNLGNRVVNQFIGLDSSVADAGHLYFQLFEAGYDWAATLGADVLQSGQTGYMAKLDLGHSLIPLWNYCEHRNRVLNAVLRLAGTSISWKTLDAQLREYLVAHPDALPGN